MCRSNLFINISGLEVGIIAAVEAVVPSLEVVVEAPDTEAVEAAEVGSAAAAAAATAVARRNFPVARTCDAPTGIQCLSNLSTKTFIIHIHQYSADHPMM